MSAYRTLLVAALLAIPAGCEPDPGPATPHWSEAFDTSAAGALSGVWGAAPDDGWIAGGQPGAGELYHYDGAAWTAATPPAGSDLLVWAYGFGPDDVFAVGVAGTAIHYDGSAWTALDTGTDADLWGVFGFARDDLWVVGAAATGETAPTILHYDGAAFTPYALDPSQNSRTAKSLFKVWGIDGTLFAVGQRGLIIRWDGSDWVETPAGALADQDFVSLWGTSADHIVAVGGRNNARLATWDGTAWTTLAPTGLGGLNAIAMTDPEEAVVGGIYGWVGTFAPATGTLTREDALTNLDVHALWDDGHGRVYAVGGRFVGTFTGVALLRTLE